LFEVTLILSVLLTLKAEPGGLLVLLGLLGRLALAHERGALGPLDFSSRCFCPLDVRRLQVGAVGREAALDTRVEDALVSMYHEKSVRQLVPQAAAVSWRARDDSSCRCGRCSGVRVGYRSES
jgi:hypothetical protein